MAAMTWYKETPVLAGMAPDALDKVYAVHNIPALDFLSPYAREAATPIGCGGIYSLDSDPDIGIEWRIVDDGTVLQVCRRWLQSDAGSVSNAPVQSPVRFVFSSVIVPNVLWSDEPETALLHCTVVLFNGTVIRMSFERPDLFYVSAREQFALYQHRLTALGPDRAPVVAHGSGTGELLVGCTDGTVLGIRLPPSKLLERYGSTSRANLQADEWQYTPSFLSPQGLITHARSLAASILRPSHGSVSQDAASLHFPKRDASQLICLNAFTSNTLGTYYFGLHRSGKLSVWSQVQRRCVGSLDLPKSWPQSQSGDRHQQMDASAGTASAPLDTRPRQCIWLLDTAIISSGHEFHIIVHLPSDSSQAFRVLHGRIDPSGVLHEFQQVATHPTPWALQAASDTPAYNLVDIAFQRSPPQCRAKHGVPIRVWTLWQHQCDSVVYFTHLSLPTTNVPIGRARSSDPSMLAVSSSRDAGDESHLLYHSVSGTHWFPVVSDVAESFDLERFSNAIVDTPDALVKQFLCHIFYPGRFSYTTIEQALEYFRSLHVDEYVTQRNLRSHGRRRDQEFNIGDIDGGSLKDRVTAGVMGHLNLSTYEPANAQLFSDHRLLLKSRWLRFLSICYQIRQGQLLPLCLTMVGNSSTAVVLRTGCLTVVRQCTAVELLWHHVDGQLSLAELSLVSPTALATICPPLLQRSCRTDMICLLEAMAALDVSLSIEDFRFFEQEMQHVFAHPVNDTFELNYHVIVDLLHSRLELKQRNNLLSILRSSRCFVRAIEQLLHIIGIDSTPSSPAAESNSYTLPALIEESISAALLQRIDAGCSVILRVLLLVLFWKREMGSSDDGQASATLGARCIATFQLYATLRQLRGEFCVSLPGVGSLPADQVDGALFDNFAASFSGLQVNESTGLQRAANTSHYISQLHWIVGRCCNIALPSQELPAAIAHAVEHIFSSLGTTGCEDTMLRLAVHLVSLHFPGEALDILSRLRPSAATCYIAATVYLARHDYEKAKEHFARAATHFDSQSSLLDPGVSQLARILPDSCVAVQSIHDYYLQVAKVFAEQQHFEYASDFCQLSIRHLAFATANNGLLSAAISCHFQYLLEQHHYDSAYEAMMSIPDRKHRALCLSTFITTLCENGEVTKFCRYAFVGLEAEVEKTLLFKARNTDINASPNYFRIIYSYSVFRSDFRNAARAMYQYAVRLQAVLSTDDAMVHILADQARSYLAAMHVIQLVDPSNAWFIIEGRQEDRDSALAGMKRQRVRREPLRCTSDKTGIDTRVVNLERIRREYALTLAKLHLLRLNVKMDFSVQSITAVDAVTLFCQRGHYEHALALSRTLALDPEPIFVNIVGKCILLTKAELASSTATAVCDTFTVDLQSDKSAVCTDAIEGSAATRAWKLLKLLLERYDSVSIHYRYRALVLKVMGSQAPQLQAPAWLLLKE